METDKIMIDIKDVKTGMVLIASDLYMYTVVFVKKVIAKDDYVGYVITNKPSGGFKLLAGLSRIGPGFHNKNKFREIEAKRWDLFLEWLFEWIFETDQEVKIK